MKWDIPTYDPHQRSAEAKPEAGSGWIKSKQRRAERVAHERIEMQDARKRDLAACHGCRWPKCEFMPKKPRLEVSHCFEHRGAGGNPDGSRTRRDRLMLVCFIHHDRIDAGDAEVHPLTDQGTDGPCTYHERNQESGRMEHVYTERSIGVSAIRGQ